MRAVSTLAFSSRLSLQEPVIASQARSHCRLDVCLLSTKGALGHAQRSRDTALLGVSREGSEKSTSHGTLSTTTEGEKGIYGYDQEIVDMEAAETPLRKIRLVAYGLLALAAVIAGGVSIVGSFAGTEDLQEFADNLPSPLLDAAVLGLAFYLWVEEVKTKRSALRVIENRRKQESLVPNRSTRRQRKAYKKSKKSKKSASRSNSAASRPVPPLGNVDTRPKPDGDTSREGVVATSEADTAARDGEKGPKMFEGMRKTLEAVNQQSYYQALALNKELEDKGILPSLQSNVDKDCLATGEPSSANTTIEGSLEMDEAEDASRSQSDAQGAAESTSEKNKRRKRRKKARRMP